jgi:hypothetical protein
LLKEDRTKVRVPLNRLSEKIQKTLDSVCR